jgi:hypothetical protein
MSIAQEARLSLLGWSFQGAGVSVRERVAFTSEEIREALTSSPAAASFRGVIVSTRHRSEIYSLAADDGAPGPTRFVSEWRGLDYAEPKGPVSTGPAKTRRGTSSGSRRASIPSRWEKARCSGR